MGIKEFALKTSLFILLPLLLVYGCLRENESIEADQKAHRACIKSLRSPATNAITIVDWVSDTNSSAGYFIRKQIRDTAVLQKIRVLAGELRPVRIVPGTYRAARLNYELVVGSGRDTCELELYQTYLGRYLLAGAGDSAYEAPRLIPFIDSVFRNSQH
jgi:hypothetical protein